MHQRAPRPVAVATLRIGNAVVHIHDRDAYVDTVKVLNSSTHGKTVNEEKEDETKHVIETARQAQLLLANKLGRPFGTLHHAMVGVRKHLSPKLKRDLESLNHAATHLRHNSDEARVSLLHGLEEELCAGLKSGSLSCVTASTTSCSEGEVMQQVPVKNTFIHYDVRDEVPIGGSLTAPEVLYSMKHDGNPFD